MTNFDKSLLNQKNASISLNIFYKVMVNGKIVTLMRRNLIVSFGDGETSNQTPIGKQRSTPYMLLYFYKETDFLIFALLVLAG